MGAIKSIIDTMNSTIKGGIEGTIKTVTGIATLDLNKVESGLTEALTGQGSNPAQASNTLIDNELEKMLRSTGDTSSAMLNKPGAYADV